MNLKSFLSVAILMTMVGFNALTVSAVYAYGPANTQIDPMPGTSVVDSATTNSGSASDQADPVTGNRVIDSATTNGNVPRIIDSATTESNVGIKNPLKWNSLDIAIRDIMATIRYIAGIIAVLAYLWVGYLYVAALGKQEKIKSAHSAFKSVTIGVAVLLGAELISQIIQNTILNLRI